MLSVQERTLPRVASNLPPLRQIEMNASWMQSSAAVRSFGLDDVTARHGGPGLAPVIAQERPSRPSASSEQRQGGPPQREAGAPREHGRNGRPYHPAPGIVVDVVPTGNHFLFDIATAVFLAVCDQDDAFSSVSGAQILGGRMQRSCRGGFGAIG